MSKEPFQECDSPPSFKGWVGVARRECTPPAETYNRNWGAASHDVSTGVHRPLEIKVVTFRAEEQGEPLIYVSLELCLLRDPEDTLFRQRLVREAGLSDMSRLILQCTHTHAAVPFCLHLEGKPGADLLVEWCHHLIEQTVEVMKEALHESRCAELSWQTGSCDLAVNRDYPVGGDREGRYACGYNPNENADQTLLVGRIVDEDQKPLLVLAHYACHPTTLAWENSLISPDFVGAASETVETHYGCPLIFLQGAAGELSPKIQYTGDTGVADRNGRVLGYAILSTLENMLPPQTAYRFDRVVTSGADLGVWKLTGKSNRAGILRSREVWVELPLIDRPGMEELQQQLRAATDRALIERLERNIRRETMLGGGKTFRVPLYFWQLGDSYWIAQSQEMYSRFQTELRKHFPGRAVLPLNDANGPHIAYVYPEELAGKSIYQVEISPFKPETLEWMIRYCVNALNEWQHSDQ